MTPLSCSVVAIALALSPWDTVTLTGVPLVAIAGTRRSGSSLKTAPGV